MSAIEISVTPACCTEGGGVSGDKKRVSGKIAKHLNIHSWFPIPIVFQTLSIMQQGMLLFRLNRSNKRIYGAGFFFCIMKFIYFFKFYGAVHRKNILIYIQQDATLHSLFYLKTALHVSGGTSPRHQECQQLYLQHLVFVIPLLLPAAIAAGSSNGLTNTRCCRYIRLRS
jgi:hypothetical protein